MYEEDKVEIEDDNPLDVIALGSIDGLCQKLIYYCMPVL